MPRLSLDHFPIMLVSNDIKWGPVPFRLDNKWLKHENFRTLVTETWRNTMVRGTASFRIAHKLKILKAEIKNWAKVTSNKRKKTSQVL